MHTCAEKSLRSPLKHSLSLADGSSWTIIGKDREGNAMGRLLAKTMRLQPSSQTASKLLIVSKSLPDKRTRKPIFSRNILNAMAGNNNVTCRVLPSVDRATRVVQLLELSQIFCRKSEERGGLAIHGALAERNGCGIILAGPGNVGKTTASKRLPAPWRSLSDDSSLIVLDKKHKYRAHPWPTWSSLAEEEEIRTWDVQSSVPLKAIFILNRNTTDSVEHMGRGQAVCLLNEAVDQAWWGLDTRLTDKERQAFRKQRFDNICRLVKTIHVYLLNISKKGSFWKEIEKIL